VKERKKGRLLEKEKYSLSRLLPLFFFLLDRSDYIFFRRRRTTSTFRGRPRAMQDFCFHQVFPLFYIIHHLIHVTIIFFSNRLTVKDMFLNVRTQNDAIKEHDNPATEELLALGLM
jgi:hypothetical protein